MERILQEEEARWEVAKTFGVRWKRVKMPVENVVLESTSASTSTFLDPGYEVFAIKDMEMVVVIGASVEDEDELFPAREAGHKVCVA